MKRTIVRCEACRNVFTGIYTNEGDLVVRGWEGCPKCDEEALRDLNAAESHVTGGDADGSSTERVTAEGASERIARETAAGQTDEARPVEEAIDDD